MSGAAVFRGTRVLVSTLFDYLEAGRGVAGVGRSERVLACATLMRVLLDECIDEGFRRHFGGHECQTCRYAGLTGLANGALLAGDVVQIESR
ncbi:MAG: hypothetical protein ABSF22_06070 [Bryobacteraceae bacterium]